jgi:lysophospholipase L1-like esterase
MRLLAVVVVIGALAVSGVVARKHFEQPASAAPVTFSAFYLDIGASASLGMQPNGIVNHNGRRTNTGYANDLVLQEAYKGIALTLTQVGCPGETVETMVSPKTGDHCFTLPTTQMSMSQQFLTAHHGDAGLVTIDLGFNDIRLCLAPAVVNQTCVNRAIAAVKLDTPKFVKQLKAAAGPHVIFVGLEYNDPYLSHYLRAENGPADAAATLVAMDSFNAALGAAYKAGGVLVADVPKYFNTDDTTLVTEPNVGTIPQNVESACQLTWMCYSTPFGPDDHPNDAGYITIAEAIAAVLPKSW